MVVNMTLTPASLIAPAELSRACDGVRFNLQTVKPPAQPPAGAVALALFNFNRS